MTIVAGEQQTMNFYMNHGADWIEPIARGLYAEIALIEEQHVTHYESLLDPLDSWLKQLVFHEYNEVYLYWSMLQNEEDQRHQGDLGAAPQHGDRPAAAACDLLRRYEGIEPEEILPAALPDTPVTFEPNKEYVREILATQFDLRTDGVAYVARRDCPMTIGRASTGRLSTPAGPRATVIEQNRAANGRERRRNRRREPRTGLRTGRG